MDTKIGWVWNDKTGKETMITSGKESNEVIKTQLLTQMIDLLFNMQTAKPNNHSSIDRHYAVTITDLEKLIAYFQVYVVENEIA